MNTATKSKGAIARFLDIIEKAGNKLPDPAILFLILMLLVWFLSAIMAPIAFSEIDPRTGVSVRIINLLTGPSLANFLANMVGTFTGFAPLGIVLVAMLGVGVAEHSGFINAGLKSMLGVTPKKLLTPMLILVAIISHTATDAGYVLVIPLGGVIFYAAGRHPLAGIAAAFAGVSGGFSANFIPSGIDPLLQGFTQSAARIIDPVIELNPLNNWFFTGLSCILIVGLGWYLTDKVVEPRLLKNSPVDDSIDDEPQMNELSSKEKKAFWVATWTMLIGLLILFFWVWPNDSAMRSPDGQVASFAAPLMRSIVPIIFIVFLLPGVIYGFLAGIYKKSGDVIQSMSKAMSGMSYYIVMAFFCALFIDAFSKSNIGALLALKGASFLQSMAFPAEVTIVGIVFLTAAVNLLVGSASAKWALISPVMVPMLMQLNISPDLTQAAYRVGDSASNIVTPLMPYFPLVVIFCQRYVKKTGIGTLVAMMIPYSIVFLLSWTAFLLIFWKLGIPLGLQSTYSYP
ncbi:MAG: AbgT family transporter [Bacteroidetes bacterium]|nr:AbgT family transporter [Bacteroidota bacterium]HET6243297.1 AbgT family transporter [Bacteroidia bacterium]